MHDQDWKEVIFKKGRKAAPSVNAAIQHGEEVITEKKIAGGTNKQHTLPVTKPSKLDAETEVFEHKHLSHEFKVTLMQNRVDKKLTQAQLASMINEKANVVADYESGKVVPNPETVQRLSKALGVKLSLHK